MKKLHDPSGGAVWNEKLVSQLAFIRKHKRFPANRQTLAPLLTIAAAAFTMPLFIVMKMVEGQSNGHKPLYWLLPLVCLPFVAGIFRYFRNLRFIQVPAYPCLADNGALVKRFLEENNFAFSRHPEAPEVFQIVSRNLGRREELREVLFFIADDGCVLLNSHFSGKTFGMPPSSGHSRSMARMLKRFLEESQVPTPSTTLARTG